MSPTACRPWINFLALVLLKAFRLIREKDFIFWFLH